jgi:hypothetical protein
LCPALAEHEQDVAGQILSTDLKHYRRGLEILNASPKEVKIFLSTRKTIAPLQM